MHSCLTSWIRRVGAVAVLGVVAFAVGGCQSAYPTRYAVGEVLPTVQGRSLKDRTVTLPGDVAGQVVVLLIVYDRAAHEDVRAWADTMARDLPGVRPIEVGVVLSPWLSLQRERLFEILRDKTPGVLRSSVVLVHDRDAEELARFTGSREPQRVRVVLLDEEGRVLFINADGHNPHSARWLAQAYAAYRQDQSDYAAATRTPETDLP